MSYRFAGSKMLLRTSLTLIAVVAVFVLHTTGQPRRQGSGGAQRAVVVDERLAALRSEPHLAAELIRRIGRGNIVTIVGAKRAPDGVMFYRVAVTSRTRGWVQAESVVSPGRAGDDEKLLRLLRGSDGFDRIARAQVFLDQFPKSRLRATVLMLYGEAAETAAAALSRDAARRLNKEEIAAGGAPPHSYFMNYIGLDRYNRHGITFVYDTAAGAFRYDGAAWREVLRRYPGSPETEQARIKLRSLTATSSR